MAKDTVASDWNNRIRNAVIKATSKIPEVGAVVSILIGIYWPENKVDIFEAIKADVTKLVNEEILDYELNLHHSEIDALKGVMQRYKEAKKHEKGNFLSNWITEADKLSVIFRESRNNIHLILPVITLASLHLAGLRERLYFGKELYDEDNTKQWRFDLEEMYKTYIVTFLPDIYKKWKVWRAERVEIKSWIDRTNPLVPDSYATVTDTLTGEKKEFVVQTLASTTVCEDVCRSHKTRMCNDANTDMAGCISATFVYLKLLPDNESKLPRYDRKTFGRMFRGPYSQDLCYEKAGFGFGRPFSLYRIRPTNDDYWPYSGPVTKVVVREWNTVDAMQLIYEKREGAVAGNASGGQRHEIDVADKLIHGLRMGFSNGVLTFVQIKYYDGTASSTYGNRSNWKCYEATALGAPAYRMSSWSYRVDPGPSMTKCPSVIQLEFAPQIEP